MRTKKNTKKYSGGEGFFDNMMNSVKKGLDKATSSTSSLFKSQTQPNVQLHQSSQAQSTSNPIYSNQQSLSAQSSHSLPASTTHYTPSTPSKAQTFGNSSFSHPSSPAYGGRKRRSKRRRKTKKRMRGGFNLEDAAPVVDSKTANPTYWLTGGKKRRSRKHKKKYTKRKRSQRR